MHSPTNWWERESRGNSRLELPQQGRIRDVCPSSPPLHATFPIHSISLTQHNTATMFRTALLRATRAAAQSSVRAAPVARAAAIRSPFVTSRISSPATRIAAIRCYASSSGLGQEEVTGRILDLLKNFDKVRRGGCRRMKYGGLT